MSVLERGTVLCLCDFETSGIDPDTDVPLEVGCLWLDDELRVIGAFESLILQDRKWGPEITMGKPADSQALRAYAVHKIHPDDFKPTVAFQESAVCSAIAAQTKRAQGRRGKVVLASDNAQFEFRIMRNMFLRNEIDFPFHYCAWDTSLLFEMTGETDPRPKHRAMADVGLVYDVLLRCRDKLAALRKA